MGTAERRLELIKHLCKVRQTTMPRLAEMFGVSVRTIQRDLLEIESTFHIPIEIHCGRYGGIRVLDSYSFDRAYMCDEELALLRKIHRMTQSQLSDEENALLAALIRTYSKTA